MQSGHRLHRNIRKFDILTISSRRNRRLSSIFNRFLSFSIFFKITPYLIQLGPGRIFIRNVRNRNRYISISLRRIRNPTFHTNIIVGWLIVKDITFCKQRDPRSMEWRFRSTPKEFMRGRRHRTHSVW